jgi:uncharacterized protein YbjT (DUF2867 family)
MKIAVFGATGGTGRAVIKLLLEQGHSVIAFARDPARLPSDPGIVPVTGDAMNEGDVARGVGGADAVIVSLGNSQNPFAMLLGAKRTTPPDICETGTRHIIQAMRGGAARRLIVVSAFGVGDTRAMASPMMRLFFRLVLREHMADKEKQEALVKASGLDWTIMQPVALTDRPAKGAWFASDAGKFGKPELSRADLAAFIAGELADPAHISRTVTISGA